MTENIANYIAGYAALLSTFLGVREIWKLRPRFAISTYFIGDPNQDDVITIYNKSTKPVVINYYCIEKNGKKLDLGGEEDFYLIIIEPHKYYNIRINGYSKFKWTGSITLYLYLIDKKKPIKLRINK